MVHPGASAYQVSKAAVSKLTEFVELEYGKQGVNCVALNPGGVLTKMTKGLAIADRKYPEMSEKEW
jgi:NAD(P)-dependent dehydrogenase (short-subunit alcohol dehydrogenase family)